MNIQAGQPFPAGALSNFARRHFTFRGVECYSMEGLLQALKFEDPNVQKEVCKLWGLKAKRRGGGKKWFRTQTLWWQGEPIGRSSKEYQDLLDEAYRAMFEQDAGARKALLATRDANLTHSIGRTKVQETVLTRREFCGRLMRIRDELKTSDLLEF